MLVFTSLAWIGPALMVIVASFGLVVNLVLSPPILGEYRTWKDWVSVCFIVAGISLAITAVESANGTLFFESVRMLVFNGAVTP